MRDRKKKYKFESVADELRKMILNNKFDGKLLPKEQFLIEHFNVSRKTILRAMDLLSKEGLLRRVKGTGTFINLDSNKTIDIAHRMVAVATQLRGHYYGSVYESIQKNLNKNNLYPVSFNVDSGHFDELVQKTNLNTLLNSPIRGLIINGAGYWRNPWLGEHPNLRTVFMDYYDYHGNPPGAAVLVDYENAFYDAVKHLAETGCRRVVFYTPSNTITIKMNDSHKANHPLFNMIKGGNRAAREFKIKTQWIICDPKQANFDEVFKFKPDGVLCMQDFHAVKIIKNALDRGMNVPSDLRVIGTFNTPWCHESTIPLSSIDTRPDELGKIAVKLLLEGENKILKLKPKLRIRNSSSTVKSNILMTPPQQEEHLFYV